MSEREKRTPAEEARAEVERFAEAYVSLTEREVSHLTCIIVGLVNDETNALRDRAERAEDRITALEIVEGEQRQRADEAEADAAEQREAFTKADAECLKLEEALQEAQLNLQMVRDDLEEERNEAGADFKRLEAERDEARRERDDEASRANVNEHEVDVIMAALHLEHSGDIPPHELAAQFYDEALGWKEGLTEERNAPGWAHARQLANDLARLRADYDAIRAAYTEAVADHEPLRPLTAAAGVQLGERVSKAIPWVVDELARLRVREGQLREIWKRRDHEDGEWWEEMGDALSSPPDAPDVLGAIRGVVQIAIGLGAAERDSEWARHFATLRATGIIHD